MIDKLFISFSPLLKYCAASAALSVLLCLVGFVPQQEPVTLTEATSQEWIAGVKNGGVSTNYTFKFVRFTSAKLQFDSVWVKDQRLALKQLLHSAPGSHSDTLLLYASVFQPKNQVGNDVRKNMLPPVPHNGQALLRYTVNGEIRFYSVPAITHLPRLLAP